jgi:hypothetical protein
MTCPACGYKRPPTTRNGPVYRALVHVGDDWHTIRTEASRYYMRELRKRYPEYEWRHTRQVWAEGWRIDARRRS